MHVNQGLHLWSEPHVVTGLQGICRMRKEGACCREVIEQFKNSTHADTYIHTPTHNVTLQQVQILSKARSLLGMIMGMFEVVLRFP